MRALITDAIRNSTQCQELFDQRVWSNSALGVGGVPAKPPFPYVLISGATSIPFQEVRKGSSAAGRTFDIYVYDRRGSYARIERGLAIIRETLRPLESQVSSTGARCLDVRWLADSGDLVDPSLDAVMKYTSFQFVSS